MSCECIIQSGLRKGQKCGVRVKFNNRCGRHMKTCILSNSKKSPVRKSASPVRKSASPVRKSASPVRAVKKTILLASPPLPTIQENKEVSFVEDEKSPLSISKTFEQRKPNTVSLTGLNRDCNVLLITIDLSDCKLNNYEKVIMKKMLENKKIFYKMTETEIIQNFIRGYLPEELNAVKIPVRKSLCEIDKYFRLKENEAYCISLGL